MNGRLEGRRLAGQQLLFLLWRQWLTKKRQWLQTAVEVLSPVLVLLALVAAYRMTDLEVIPERIYTDSTWGLINRTGSSLAAALGGRGGAADCLATAVRGIKLTPLEALAATTNTPWPPWDWNGTGAHASNVSESGTKSSGLFGFGAGSSAGSADLGRLQDAAAEELIAGLAAAEADEDLKQQLLQCGMGAAARLAGSLVQIFMSYIGTHGPLPSLTFDEFVLLSRTLEGAMGLDPDLARVLRNFKRDFGWNWLGNLVGLGGLAFTPATPDVLRFAAHMSATHAYFDDVFMGVYDDPNELWRMAADGQSFWAVIEFSSGPSPRTGVDFTIRMPLLETPQTWVTVDKFGHHVARRYKMYVTSGFMALQGAVHAYVLGHNASLESSLVVPRQRGLGCSPGRRCGVALAAAEDSPAAAGSSRPLSDGFSAPNIASWLWSFLNNGTAADGDTSAEGFGAGLLGEGGEGSAGSSLDGANGGSEVEAPPLEWVPYNTWFAAMPTPGFVFNRFYQAVGPMLGLLLCLSLIFPLAMLTRGVVEEKELKQRELLLVMGLRPGPLMLSWALTYLAVFLAVSVLSVLVAGSTFLAASSKSLLLAYYAAFSAAEVAFGLMLAALFTRAKVAAVVAPLAHFAAAMPRYVFFKTGAPQAMAAKYAVCLLAPSAFTFGADLVARYEDSGAGLQWADVWADEGLPFGAVCAMMALDALLYSALAAYLTRVLPQSPGGYASPWYFPCGSPRSGGKAASWLANRLRRLRGGSGLHGIGASSRGSGSGDVALTSLAAGNGRSGANSAGGHGDAEEGLSLLGGGTAVAAGGNGGGSSGRSGGAAGAAGGNGGGSSGRSGGAGRDSGLTLGALADARAAEAAEAAARDPRIAAVLHRLRLRYPNGVTAVRGLSLQLRTGELTALLGHNGAGKSSTISLLTGLVAPSSGDCWVGGRSVVRDTQAARLSIGLCPQHNVLFPALTVLEHLVLVAGIKGVPGAGGACVAAASRMAATVGLGGPQERATMAGNLSGGMKRKLQVGMALIGGSKLVVLDEPSAGMCPAARRGLWALLRAVQRGEAGGEEQADGGGAEARGEVQGSGGSSGRALLMSTHHLEEADILADKVAIMSEGRLVALGSPLELKEQHAGGYFLTLTRGTEPTAHESKADDATAQIPAAGVGAAAPTYGSVEALLAAVAGRVPGARLVRSAAGGREVVVRLPREEAHLFPSLFELLEDPAVRQQLGVAHYGLAMPTMEEVFLATTTTTTTTKSAATTTTATNGAVVAGSPPPKLSTHAATSGSPAEAEQPKQGRSLHPLSAPGVVETAAAAAAEGIESTVPTYDMYESNGASNGQATQIAVPSSNGGPGVSDMDFQGRGALPQWTDQEMDQWQPAQEPQTRVRPVPRPKGETEEGPAEYVRGDWRHHWRCFRQMCWKRSRVTVRDWKGLAWLFLLPIVAIALTLLVLTANIDPTGPSLLLSLRSMEQFTPVPVANNPAPTLLAGCLGPSRLPPESGGRGRGGKRTIYEGWVPAYLYKGEKNCPLGMEFESLNASISNSTAVSRWLLDRAYGGGVPEYGALVYDDPAVLSIASAVGPAADQVAAAVMGPWQEDQSQLATPAAYIRLLSAPGGLQRLAAAAARHVDPQQLAAALQPLLDKLPKTQNPTPDQRGSKFSGQPTRGAGVGGLPGAGRRLDEDSGAAGLLAEAADDAKVAGRGAGGRQVLSTGASSATVSSSTSGGSRSRLEEGLEGAPDAPVTESQRGVSDQDGNAGAVPGTAAAAAAALKAVSAARLCRQRERSALVDALPRPSRRLTAQVLKGSAGTRQKVEGGDPSSGSGFWGKAARGAADVTASLGAGPAGWHRGLLSQVHGDVTAPSMPPFPPDGSLGGGLEDFWSGGAGREDDSVQGDAGSDSGDPGDQGGDWWNDDAGEIGDGTEANDPDLLASLLAKLMGASEGIGDGDSEAGPGSIDASLLDLLGPILSAAASSSAAAGDYPAAALDGGDGDSAASGAAAEAAAQLVSQILPYVTAVLASSGAADVNLAATLADARRVQRVLGGMAARFAQPPVLLLFNGSAWHSSVALLNDARQALASLNASAAAGLTGEKLEAAVADGSLPTLLHLERPLRLTNHPLPLTSTDAAALDTFLTVLAAIFVLVPFCYLSGAYAVAPVSESRCGSKALQLGAGCASAVYWAGHLAFDAAVHLAVAAVALATFAAFGDDATSASGDRAAATFLLLLGYGLGVAPLSYCFSLRFTSPSAAQVTVSAVNFLLGFMFVVGSQTMQGIPECQAFQRVAVHFCRLLPPFNLGEGLISLATYNLMAKVAADLQQQQQQQASQVNGTSAGAAFNKDSIIPSDALPEGYSQSGPFDWNVVGRNLAALYGGAVLYFILVVVLDRYRSDPRWGAAVRRALRRPVGEVAVFCRAIWVWLTDGAARRRWRGEFRACLAAARAVRRAQEQLLEGDLGAEAEAVVGAGAVSREQIGERAGFDVLGGGGGSVKGMDRTKGVGDVALQVSARPASGSKSGSGDDGGYDVEAASLLLPYSEGHPGAKAVADGYTGGGRRGSLGVGTGNGDVGVKLSAAAAATGGGFSHEDVSEPAAVAAERLRVEGPDGGAAAVVGDAVCVRRLRKVYPTQPPKVALSSLSLGIRPGERFGFLGANGAGKSTALSIIAGQQLPSSGTAAVASCDVVAERERAMHLLGYCPQTDPLLEHLSAREQLCLVARLKGLPEHRVEQDVRDLMARCALPLTAVDRPAGQLSGGNRRKVSLAAALIGSPVAVLLDEPSAGMDPGARRMMWDAILTATSVGSAEAGHSPAGAGGGGTSWAGDPAAPATPTPSCGGTPSPAPIALVLTTHYMDECEVLCERVGIMARGRLVCLGAPQELKSLYGSDYLLELQLAQQIQQQGHQGRQPGECVSPLSPWALAAGGAGGVGAESVPAGPARAVTPAEASAVVVARLAAVLPGARLREAHEGHLKVALPARGLSLARVFQVLESERAALGVATYSVSQPTLEQVFLAVTGGAATIDEDGDAVEEGQGGQ